ncbi:hypothetical protein M0R45_029794 [Rubus argutus]|uniref:Cupin type-1 domain-containing protein n=1 Tax=Rubus argutus TaxID=59490 RepID=A0AAW1WBQ8_RUBAR
MASAFRWLLQAWRLVELFRFSHRGATELSVIVNGSSIAGGFIASNNKVYLKVLNKGDTMVFPRVHYPSYCIYWLKQ